MMVIQIHDVLLFGLLVSTLIAGLVLCLERRLRRLLTHDKDYDKVRVK
jgi:hypothetical protein